jgi:pyridoxine 4-dehydrogenase
LRASVEGNLRSLGVDRLPVVNLRRLDTGPGLRPEGDQVIDIDDQLAVMTALRDEGIAWVPFFPLGGSFPGLPRSPRSRPVRAVAESLGVTPAQVGLAWLLHHASNVLLIPGTANAAHLEANMAASEIAFDDATLAALDAAESRSNEVPIG